MRTAFLFLGFVFFATAQTNPNCPNATAATGTNPHCVVLNWTAPAIGSTPTGYNVYRETTSGVCATGLTASGCTKLTTTPVAVPTTTYTDNSSTSNVLTEGTTYYYVATSVNSAGESAPSNETSGKIPVLLPGSPTGVTATPK